MKTREQPLSCFLVCHGHLVAFLAMRIISHTAILSNHGRGLGSPRVAFVDANAVLAKTMQKGIFGVFRLQRSISSEKEKNGLEVKISRFHSTSECDLMLNFAGMFYFMLHISFSFHFPDSPISALGFCYAGEEEIAYPDL